MTLLPMAEISSIQAKVTDRTSTILLTGGIGSGKSLVSSYLISEGVPVYDSDSRTKALYDNDPSIVTSLESSLGVNLHDSAGRLDRKALAGVIFSDRDSLAKVEAIVHPAVLEDFLRWKEGSSPRFPNRFGTAPFVVMESAIALEKPLFRDVFDAVVLVTAPLLTRVERVRSRDSAKEEDILRRISSQKFDPMDADAVINNDLDEEELRRRTDLAMKFIQNKLSLHSLSR